MSSSAMRKLFDNSVRKRLPEVLSIYSVSGREKELGNYLKSYMQQVGLYVETEKVAVDRFNVYGRTKKTRQKPKLMFNCHYDVVHEGSGWTRPPFGGKVEGDKVYGRGAVDMKGGVVAMIETAAQLVQSDKEDVNVAVAAVVDEEETQAGTKKIVESGKVLPSLAIVGEPTRLRVVRAHKGEAVFEIKVQGKSAHSSGPENGINSIYHAARIIRKLERHGLELRKKNRHPLLGWGTVSVDMISGGTSLATVPAETTIVVDRRMIPGEDPGRVEGEFREIVSEVKERGIPNLKASVRRLITAFPLETPEEHPLVQTALESCAYILGRRSAVTGAPYSTDGWVLANAGVPTIVLGPGDISRAHRPDEWVSMSEVASASQIYAEIATRIS